MSPGAAKGDLMYVADTKDDVVNVYTYPTEKLAGTLTGFEGLSFLCVDRTGDVFIPSYGLSEILEYAHGGTSPIATLKVKDGTTYACAVDSKSGNLALTTLMAGENTEGEVLVYAHARGTPRTHPIYQLENAYFCSYDDAGDLFVDGNVSGGSGGSYGLVELTKGAHQFQTVTLDHLSAYANGLQWEVSYLAVGAGTIAGPSSGNTYVYHMQVSHFIARTIGTTQLKEDGPTATFFIDGSTILVAGGETQPRVDFFAYPAGGKPSKTLPETSPYGVVVSTAAR
ncbi:MAG: hypothetical protein WAK19_06820 [Candidatus Cybelea sp.]